MASFLPTQPYKGARDFYPEDMRFRRWMFGILRQQAERFGYGEYDGPLLEPIELYAAKSGDELVTRQLYKMVDQGDRAIAIRPEMTPTLARLVAKKINELPRPIRLYSIPNLWRYERPQKGRLREHWQFNADVLGGNPLPADLEILSLAYSVMEGFGGAEHIRIRVNHRGLMDAFFKNLALSEAQTLAVMAAIDGKEKVSPEEFLEKLNGANLTTAQIEKVQELFTLDLAAIAERYPSAGAEHLRQVFLHARQMQCGTKMVFDPTIMRGMLYYTGMVFEIYDTSPENRRALFGGGRYDGLISLFHKEALSGVGFGMGDVTLEDFLTVHHLKKSVSNPLIAWVGLTDLNQVSFQTQILEKLRATSVACGAQLEPTHFGNQIKNALKHGAKVIILLGDEEAKRQSVLVKDLVTQAQQEVEISDLPGYFKLD